MEYTRRELGKLMLTVPAAGLLPRDVFGAWQAKPNSKWAGVQVGLNVPYNFGSRTMSADETLQKTVQLGVNAVEMRSQPIELAMGRQPPPSPEAGETRRKSPRSSSATWRLANDPKKAADVRKKLRGRGRPHRGREVRRHLRVHRSRDGLRVQPGEGRRARVPSRASWISPAKGKSAWVPSPTSTS